jgi:hypothetical protein
MKKWGKKPIQLELNRPMIIWDRDKKKIRLSKEKPSKKDWN